MKEISRRTFIKSTGALAAAPALASVASGARAQQQQDAGELRVERDIVFGKEIGRAHV